MAASGQVSREIGAALAAWRELEQSGGPAAGLQACVRAWTITPANDIYVVQEQSDARSSIPCHALCPKPAPPNISAAANSARVKPAGRQNWQHSHASGPGSRCRQPCRDPQRDAQRISADNRVRVPGRRRTSCTPAIAPVMAHWATGRCRSCFPARLAFGAKREAKCAFTKIQPLLLNDGSRYAEPQAGTSSAQQSPTP